MGSHYSIPPKKIELKDLQDDSVLFSEFCEMMKQSHCRDHFLADKLRLNFPLNFPVECSAETMEVIVHLWCTNCLSETKWQSFRMNIKNRIIHDFLNTLYCTSHAFDELFLLLFTNSKSRSLLFGNLDKTALSSNVLHNIVVDMLSYSAVAGLKYCTHIDGQKYLESIVDFPLKTFSLCPCTRRPLYVAMYLSRPDVVKILLKFGAKIPYEDVCNCLKDSRHPLKNVMEVLKVSCENTKQSDCYSSTTHKNRNISSLKLVLVDMNHCNNNLWLSMCETLQNLTGTEEYGNIPTLKHICRAQIRRIMRGNPFFSQPYLWQPLCLPETLISYMNLDDCYDLSQQ